MIQDINERPQLSLAGLNVDENSPFGTLVSGNFTVFDPDRRSDGRRDVVTLTMVDPTGMFDIVNNQVRVIREGLDYETRSSHVVSIIATDQFGANSGVSNVVITVNDVNEAPTIENLQLVVAENQPALAKLLPSLNAHDPEGVPSSSA